MLTNNEKLFDTTLRSIKILIKKLNHKVYHCYNNDNNQVDVFLEDYCYFALLLVTLYEIENDQVYLDKCRLLSEKVWELFYNEENNFLQKNIIKENDLFIEPIDISDNNIPNGNSIYLIICNKLKNITGNDEWQKRINILSKSYHSYINFNFSQMFSYIKALNICDNNVTITLFGEYKNNKKLLKEVNALSMGDVTIIHKESKEEFFGIICKNKTCSEKLKNINELSGYFKNLSNA